MLAPAWWSEEMGTQPRFARAVSLLIRRAPTARAGRTRAFGSNFAGRSRVPARVRAAAFFSQPSLLAVKKKKTRVRA